MIAARVIGTVWSTAKEENLVSLKLLLVKKIDDTTGHSCLVAADSVGAGPGDVVLVVDEGGSARQCVGLPDAPINAAVVGIVDNVSGYGGA